MKTKTLTFTSILCLCLFAIGCSALYKTAPPVAPNVAQYGAAPIVTNANTSVTAQFPTAASVPPTAIVSGTNSNGTVVATVPAPVVYTINPGLQTGLNAASAVTPLIPPPYGEIASGVLGLLSIGLGWGLKVKNGQATTAQAVTQAVIAGVEAAGNDSTKAAIQSHAAAAGVQDVLDPLVQAVTKQMPTVPVAPPKA